MPAGQEASLFWYFQVSGTSESNSPQHVSCSHIGGTKRSGPIRVGRLRPASLVGSLGKRSLNILRSLPAPMIQLAALIQVHSGGFVRRSFLSSAGGRRPRSWLRSNSLARCKLRRHNQSFQPTCIPWLRHSMQAAELKRWQAQQKGLSRQGSLVSFAKQSARGASRRKSNGTAGTWPSSSARRSSLACGRGEPPSALRASQSRGAVLHSWLGSRGKLASLRTSARHVHAPHRQCTSSRAGSAPGSQGVSARHSRRARCHGCSSSPGNLVAQPGAPADAQPSASLRAARG